MNDVTLIEEDVGPEDGEALADAAGLERLLDHMKKQRAFDFSGYKRASLSRRILRRMQTVGLPSYGAYVDYLEVHPDEFPHLFNTVLINVTAFFRDDASWTALADHLRETIANKPEGEPIRIWSAGCASGEEAFSVAMVLAEIIGLDAVARRAKIYATDVDEEALAHARLAVYSEKAVQGVPASYLAKYFTQLGATYAFNKELRRTVIFGRHDLLQDAPISRIDVLLCRNALMYFNAEAQTRILSRLNYALVADGVLMLGKAEMLLTHSDLFRPLELKLRLFAPMPRADKHRERAAGPTPLVVDGVEGHATDRQNLTRAALMAAPVAVIVIDQNSSLTLINTKAMVLFGLSARDLGRAFQELELSYRPAELRSCIDQARTDRRPNQLRAVERTMPSGEVTYLDVDICPLLGERGSLLGLALVFVEITLQVHLKAEVRRAHVELEGAHAELQSTSEELETTNEELQSTVEELETTNEELQSTNEELEAMNEELQSTNAELQTTNEELEERGVEIHVVNGFFRSILASLKCGIVVLDADRLVRAWNTKMEDLWGLRGDEVLAKDFLHLDVGIPLAELEEPIKHGLAGEGGQERTLACTNRRGRAAPCKVAVTPLRTGPRGVIIMFEEMSDESGSS